MMWLFLKTTVGKWLAAIGAVTAALFGAFLMGKRDARKDQETKYNERTAKASRKAKEIEKEGHEKDVDDIDRGLDEYYRD